MKSAGSSLLDAEQFWDRTSGWRPKCTVRSQKSVPLLVSTFSNVLRKNETTNKTTKRSTGGEASHVPECKRKKKKKIKVHADGVPRPKERNAESKKEKTINKKGTEKK